MSGIVTQAIITRADTDKFTSAHTHSHPILFALAVPQTTDTTSKCHAVATSLKSLTWSQEPVVVTVTRTTQAAKNISQAVIKLSNGKDGK